MEFLDYIDEQFDTEFVSGGSQIKIKGQCPFCLEDREDLRLYIGVKSNKGQCFHCGRGFGPIAFIMANERCSYEKAKAILDDDHESWAKHDEDGSKGGPSPLIFPSLEAIESSPQAIAYLTGRGINQDVIDNFGLAFTRHNVVIKGKMYFTNNRIIVPIHDISGKPASWQGRDITGKQLKYLFPPGFKGAEFLYNAWSVPVGADYLVICEGTFDTFGWWHHGIRNVVATFGKKISEPQVDLLRYLKPKAIFIAWDYDAIGKNYEFAEKYGHLFNIKIVNMNGKDSDEMNKQEIITVLGNSKGYSWREKILALL